MREMLIAINATDWLDDIQLYEDYLEEVHCTDVEKEIVTLFIAHAHQEILQLDPTQQY